ncbi:histidine kinase [Vibrio sp. 05-20-BW147]|uniref:FIST signal transduction protein n=1 Tax=Vibrio sp. 05-20-BW147 TaxID=2575834 RepID=UPI0015932B45|nr:FIST N-terminal domain-containing protein [Vibrio sp. 05-20-BW147]NVC63934.1 histidine kinase [Vibrio sp. 05-20-BW147]
MLCQSVFSHITHENLAVIELKEQIVHEHLAMLICYYTEEYSCERLRESFQTHFPGIPIHGSSSCRAIMTDKGYHSGPVIGVFAIYDSGSNAYGTGISHINTAECDITATMFYTLNMALKNADRIGEVPSLILLHATPGHEESIIKAIDEKFGTLVPIIGGSAADNQVEGNWSIFTNQGTSKQGVSLTVFFSSQSIFTAFSAGHTPTELTGTVTKVRGREILEIDNLPASQVYRDWTKIHLDESERNQLIFDIATAYPLGRIAGQLYDYPYFILSHPVRETENQGIELFSSIEEGEQIFLMQGCKDQLISRAAKVINAAFWQKLEDSQKIGVINIFCAGPMIHLQQDIDRVLNQLMEELDDRPFICPFTFGEQGRFVGGENGHGNLMISSAIFHSPVGDKSYDNV